LNILVTGAAGYIGSICSEVLIARGHRVIALDNLQEGHRAAVPPQAVFCLADLAIRPQIEEVFSRHKPEAVMHFAGEALVAKSVREPSTFYAANIACGVNLLDAMIRHNVKRFIFSSTAATYGEPHTVPIPEDHSKEPINPYGKSKLRFEEILSDYRAYTGLHYATLRYFNAAGASIERGEHHRVETHLIPRVLDAATGAIPQVDVFGIDYPTKDGTCVRDYIHVLTSPTHIRASKKSNAFRRSLQRWHRHRLFHPRKSSPPSSASPARNPTQLSPRRPGDPATLVASNEKLARVLGWKASHSTLDEVVSSAWLWKQKHPNGYLGAS
jgi:UDP-glucose 4-epimerase